jgi:hypothetical protein
MAPNPVIFAMANPDPEITPEEVHAVRKDAIMGTGRSDYPNQVNNVLGFPYIFRGALDVRARRVNHEMKIACANALAMLAREDVPDEVAAAYHGRQLKFGPNYIIPSAFDPRLIWYVPPFVAQAAMDTGVARKPIEDMDAYRASLAQRLDPTAGFLQKISARCWPSPSGSCSPRARTRRSSAPPTPTRPAATARPSCAAARTWCTRTCASWAWIPTRRAWRSSTPASATVTPTMSTPSTPACSARAI